MAVELPEAFLEHMRDLLGDEYEAYLDSGQCGGFRGLRVNTSKVEAEKFAEISPFPLERIPWIPNGFYLDADAPASLHPYYAAGLYYLQEPSAMTPAAFLPIQENDRVLDLCAAPGGKATELAARLGGKGLLVANDISNSRAKGLLKNLELFGQGNILVTSESPERLASYFPQFFDKILVDAPCSGEGMFRKDPSMVKDWAAHGPDWYAPIQREIVRQAARMLKPGGMLLYSTCTFSPKENEGTIAHLLEYEPSLRICSLPEYEGFAPGRPDLAGDGRKAVKEEGKLSTDLLRQLEHCVRIYPHRMRGEGHFLALLQKSEAVLTEDNCGEKIGEQTGIRKKKGTTLACPEWEQFAKALGIHIPPESLRLYDGKLYSLPAPLWNHSIRGLRFLRTGLYLGDVEKKRFIPSQPLAMTLKKDACAVCADFPASDQRVVRYLKGETLILQEEDFNTDSHTELPGSGWCLVCVDGFPLGWGKLVNGQLRNKYYPGWRWQHAAG